MNLPSLDFGLGETIAQVRESARTFAAREIARPGVFTPLPVDLAQRPDQRNGRRTGRQRAGHRAP
jgi:hypothetical protein